MESFTAECSILSNFLSAIINLLNLKNENDPAARIVASVPVSKCERRDLNPYAEAPAPKTGVSTNFTTLAGEREKEQGNLATRFP